MITRTFNVVVTINNATGMLTKKYKGSVIDATLTASGQNDIFTTLNGPLVINGKINKAVDKNHKEIDIKVLENSYGFSSEIKDLLVQLVNGKINVVNDNKNSKVTFDIALIENGTKIDPITVTIQGKGFLYALIVGNINISGKGIKFGEDKIDDVTPPNPNPPSVFTPLIGLSGLTYYWYTAKKDNKLKLGLDTIASICDEIKLPRNVISFTLEVHSDGARPGANVASWKNHFKERCEAIPEVVSLINSYGFGNEVIVWNSNTPGKGYSKSWNKNDTEGNKKFILDQARPLIKKIGWERTIWLTCNEDDSSTPKTIQDALKALRSEFGIPADRYISNDTDVHPSNVNNLPSLSKPKTFTSDNGPIIAQLYDNLDYWNASGFNLANHKKVVDEYVDEVLFNFYNLVLEETINKHKENWKEVLKYFKIKAKIGDDVTPITGLQPSQVKWLTSRGKDYKNARIVFNITSARIEGGRLYFKTDKPFPTSWVKREKGVNSVGFLIRKKDEGYVGGKCEWCVETRGWYDIRTNVKAGYNGHTLPSTSETVWCGIGHPDNGSKCSSLVPVIWPTEKSPSIFQTKMYEGEFKVIEVKYEGIG